MERSPLWPLSPPPSFMRSAANGRSSSSWITMMVVGLKNFTALATGPPERFMKLRGLARTTRWPFNRPSTISAPDLWALNLPLTRAASSSRIRKPMLWRLPSYFGPGLPRPTISVRSFWARSSATEPQLLLEIVQQRVHRRHLVALAQQAGRGAEPGVADLRGGHGTPAVQVGRGAGDEGVDFGTIVSGAGLRQ